MLQPPVKKVRVVERFADDADAVVAEVCSPGWAERARVVKDTEKVSVLLGEAGGREVVVKTVRGRVFGSTKLRRDVEAWEWFEEEEVLVPDYIGLVRGAGDRGAVESLLMERAPGHSLLWELAHGEMTVREEHEMARAVGKLVSDLIGEADVENKDLKPSNIQVVARGTDPVLAMLDLDGMIHRRYFRGFEYEWAARMLGKLVIECIGCDVLPRRSVLMRAIDSTLGEYESWLDVDRDDQHRHDMWREVESIIQEHGDPTPKDDPLEFDRRMMGID